MATKDRKGRKGFGEWKNDWLAQGVEAFKACFSLRSVRSFAAELLWANLDFPSGSAGLRCGRSKMDRSCCITGGTRFRTLTSDLR